MKYDLSKIKNFKALSKENILEIISEEEIMRHYLGFEFSLHKTYHSPLRNEKTPSFALYYNAYGQLRFKDFNGAQGTCFDFIMLKFGLSFFDGLRKINKDLGLNLGNNNNNTVKITKITYPEFKIKTEEKKHFIQFKPQHFTRTDLLYWKKYNITEKTLLKYSVFSAKYVFLNKKLIFRYTNGNPVYCYKFNTSHVKVYRPFQDKTSGKWLSNATSNDIQGYEQLAYKSDTLIITKSLKDVMCLYEMGIEAIAPQAEGTYFPEEILEVLKNKFTFIYILYDDDETGQKGSKVLTEKLNCKRIFITEKKDISDYVEAYGIKKGIEFIKNKIK